MKIYHKRPRLDETLANGSSVFWSATRKHKGRLHTPVSCGGCGQVRLYPSSQLMHRQRTGKLNGFCTDCFRHTPWLARLEPRRQTTRTTKRGYVKVYIPDHPMADKRGEVYQHRLVMASQLGRSLKRHEHVHHKNRVRSDNRPENLEIVNGRFHVWVTALEQRIQTLEKLLTENGIMLPP